MKHQEQDQLLTQEEVAQRLAVSESTVKRLRSSGKLPSVTVGERSARWKQSTVNAYIARLR